MSESMLCQEAFLESFNQLEHIELNKLETFARMAPSLFISKDKNHRYLVCNHSFTKLCGTRPEEIKGLTDLDMHWDDAGNSAEDFFRDDKMVMQGGQLENQHEILIPPGKKANVLKVTKKPLLAGKKCIGVVGYGVNYSDVFSHQSQAVVFPPKENKLLTMMEYRVLVFYNQGYSRTEMAAFLEVSPHTIAWHLRQIRLKYNIRTRRELLLLQQRHEEA